MSNTLSSDDTGGAVAAPPARRERPPITEGEDRPLEDTCTEGGVPSQGDNPVIKTIAEKEQAHKHKVEDYKNLVGGILLAVCFGIIVIFSLVDAFTNVSSSLFEGAFEFSKTIATAVIGYLFASNMKEK